MTHTTDFSNLTIGRRAVLVSEGWGFRDGIPSMDGTGYHAAREGGGYESEVTPTPTTPILVERGTPAYHATVAWHVGDKA